MQTAVEAREKIKNAIVTTHTNYINAATVVQHITVPILAKGLMNDTLKIVFKCRNVEVYL